MDGQLICHWCGCAYEQPEWWAEWVAECKEKGREAAPWCPDCASAATVTPTNDYASDVHVMPVDDLKEHVESRSCWCGPTVTQAPETDALAVHNSMDGRELVERHGLQ